MTDADKTDEVPEPAAAEIAEHCSTSFYLELLDLPACKRGRPCDFCGRCEH